MHDRVVIGSATYSADWPWIWAKLGCVAFVQAVEADPFFVDLCLSILVGKAQQDVAVDCLVHGVADITSVRALLFHWRISHFAGVSLACC